MPIKQNRDLKILRRLQFPCLRIIFCFLTQISDRQLYNIYWAQQFRSFEGMKFHLAISQQWCHSAANRSKFFCIARAQNCSNQILRKGIYLYWQIQKQIKKGGSENIYISADIKTQPPLPTPAPFISRGKQKDRRLARGYPDRRK